MGRAPRSAQLRHPEPGHGPDPELRRRGLAGADGDGDTPTRRFAEGSFLYLPERKYLHAEGTIDLAVEQAGLKLGVTGAARYNDDPVDTSVLPRHSITVDGQIWVFDADDPFVAADIEISTEQIAFTAAWNYARKFSICPGETKDRARARARARARFLHDFGHGHGHGHGPSAWARADLPGLVEKLRLHVERPPLDAPRRHRRDGRAGFVDNFGSSALSVGELSGAE